MRLFVPHAWPHQLWSHAKTMDIFTRNMLVFSSMGNHDYSSSYERGIIHVKIRYSWSHMDPLSRIRCVISDMEGKA